MQIGSAVTWEQVILTWLRSEGKSLSLPHADRKRLIENADLGNEADNADRIKLLKEDLNRAAILDGLPSNVTVNSVAIEAPDVPRLYIVPTPDWYLDTGRTFRLTETGVNLKPGRIMDLGDGPKPVAHFEKVAALESILMGYRFVEATESLVLISENRDGPYMIIDGTHRATALFRNRVERKTDNLPWKALLVSSPYMKSSPWHVDSPFMPHLDAIWAEWAHEGRLR
jgi:hypothetical protein